MKFTVNKSDITEAVSNIQRAVSTKTSIPALEGILIGASEEGLELCAYDLELGITTVIPAFVVEPGKAVLSAKLFSDIVRRTPAETVTVTVDEKNMATLESGYSRFSIIGIPAADVDRVFERFYRVDKSHSKEIGGTGLGLSIVKHGAAFHNAKVSLQSTEGEGTTVRLVFPN